MSKAAILYTTEVVKSEDIEVKVISLWNGLVKKFVYKNKLFSFFSQSDFKEEEQYHRNAVGGFYEQDSFLKYLSNHPGYDLGTIGTYKLQIGKDIPLAETGDEINLELISLTPPFDSCRYTQKYKWIYTKGLSYIDLNTTNINIPSNATLDGPPILRNFRSETLSFYSHKWTLYIENELDSNMKLDKARAVTSIAMKIDQILGVYDLFPFENGSQFSDFIQNQKDIWTSLGIFNHPDPTSDELWEYNSALADFYEIIFKNQLFISSLNEIEKFGYFIKLLSPQALSIVDIDIKIDVLTKLSKQNEIKESNGDELLVLSILESMLYEAVDDGLRHNFLYRLLKVIAYDITFQNPNILPEHVEDILFKSLFEKMDDNRITRYTFGIFNAENNRQKFIVLLYQIWKRSSYNPHYEDSSYTQPRNQFGVFPESYFMMLENDATGIQKTKYFNASSSPPVLVFNTSSDSFHFHSESTFELKNWNGKYIEINENRESTIFDGHFTSHDSVSETYGIYHLFQPITIIGFKPDLDLVESFKDPETGLNLFGETPTIPVFIFLYLENYSSLKKIDFGIMLGVEIAINLTGVGALSKLKYINYLSKARGAIMGTETATNTLLFYEAASGANAVVQFTAGNLMAISNYVSNTTTDLDIQRFMNKVSAFCGILTIFSICAHPSVKRKLFDSAADVLAEERQLILDGKPHGLSEAVMDSIRGLYGIDGLIDLMQIKLNNLPSYVNQNIIIKFATFTSDEKYQFYVYFYNMQDEAKWFSMNIVKYRNVSNTIQEYTLVDIWKDEIFFLKNYRTFEFLEAFNRFRYVNYHEFEHVRFLHDDAGGHWFVYVTDDINQVSAVKYSIVKSNVSSSVTNIPLGLRTTVENVNGHLLYENLWYVKPNQTPTQFNNLNVSKKAVHYVVNPSWNEQRLVEEMSYAWTNKIEHSRPPSRNEIILGTSYEVKTIKYRSKFSDGTKIEFIQRSHQIDPVTGTLKMNHLSLMSIVKKYK